MLNQLSTRCRNPGAGGPAPVFSAKDEASKGDFRRSQCSTSAGPLREPGFPANRRTANHQNFSGSAARACPGASQVPRTVLQGQRAPDRKRTPTILQALMLMNGPVQKKQYKKQLGDQTEPRPRASFWRDRRLCPAGTPKRVPRKPVLDRVSSRNPTPEKELEKFTSYVGAAGAKGDNEQALGLRCSGFC